jgi:hypothetical protein
LNCTNLVSLRYLISSHHNEHIQICLFFFLQ